MLSRAISSAALARSSAPRSGSLLMRAFASDAGDKNPQAPRQQRPRGKNNNNNRFDDREQPRKFSFKLKDKKSSEPRKQDGDKNDQADKPQQGGKGQKKFSFAPSVTAKEKEPELEVFEAPAYWNEDFPADFDDSMKHEVEKLEIFADFTMLIDSSWQKEIHPLFDGSDIELTLNAPLEDFDERLFIDDKNTFDTKVVMEVPLTCFTGLTPEGIEFVKKLAGPRYNANKKHLKLTEDRYPSRVHNHKRLCDILRDLTQTASELAAGKAVEAEQ